MSCFLALLLLCWSTLTLAAERGPAVGAAVGMGVLGELPGAPLGVLAYGGLREIFPPECASSPGPYSCEGFAVQLIGVGVPVGAAFGAAGGASLGSLFISNAPRRAVLRNTLITAGVGAGLVLLTPVTESAAPYILGAPICLIGVPLVAGLTAASAPDEAPRGRRHVVALQRVTPSLSQTGASLTLSGRF